MFLGQKTQASPSLFMLLKLHSVVFIDNGLRDGAWKECDLWCWQAGASVSALPVTSYGTPRLTNVAFTPGEHERAGLKEKGRKGWWVGRQLFAFRFFLDEKRKIRPSMATIDANKTLTSISKDYLTDFCVLSCFLLLPHFGYLYIFPPLKCEDIYHCLTWSYLCVYTVIIRLLLSLHKNVSSIREGTSVGLAGVSTFVICLLSLINICQWMYGIAKGKEQVLLSPEFNLSSPASATHPLLHCQGPVLKGVGVTGFFVGIATGAGAGERSSIQKEGSSTCHRGCALGSERSGICHWASISPWIYWVLLT